MKFPSLLMVAVPFVSNRSSSIANHAIRCDGNAWQLVIRRTTTGKTHTFAGSSRRMNSLQGILIQVGPLEDQEMEAFLENREKNWTQDE